MKTQHGFSLIELMVALVIMGIIATFAVPSYQRNVIASSRKTDAMPALLDIMRAQENYFANRFTYTEDLTDLKYSNPEITASERYSIATKKCTDSTGVELAITSCIKLRATGIDGKGGYLANGTDDAYLELDSLGNRNVSGVDGWLN